MLLSEAFEMYRRDFIVFRNQSKRTEEMHLCALKSLTTFMGDPDIATLTFQSVRDWKENLERTRAANTVRGYILKLRVVLAYALKRGYQTLDPDSIGIPKRENRAVTFVTPEEVAQLIEAIGQLCEGYDTINRRRNMAMISFLYASGIRVTELIHLNTLDIQDDGTFTIIGKGGKIRLCFIDKRTKDLLQSYQRVRKDRSPALFISSSTGERISKSTVEEVFRTARRRAGMVRPISPHTMRHSFATNLLRNNTNLYYVSKMLGHSSTQTTEMYLHYVDNDLKKTYELHHTT